MNVCFYRQCKRLSGALGIVLWWLMTLALSSAASAQTPAGSLLFILDGSGSMWGQIEGQAKITIAREVMGRLVSELPQNVRAGLQAYGHRSKGDCNDIELLVPIGDGNREQLLAAINALKPKGKTPITQAFEQAAEQLRAIEEETTVVLVSDGKETCERDPCTLVRDLRAQGIKIQVHVVGFDVGAEEREQLICIAEAGGGRYFSAQNADQLTDALTRVKEEVIRKAEVKPAPKKPAKKVIKIGTLGTIKIPNLKDGHIAVYEQSSGKKAGEIWSHMSHFLHVPAGTYKLAFGEIMLEGIEVGPSDTQEIYLGTIAIPNLKDGHIAVYEQSSGKKAGEIWSHMSHFLQIPAGTYKLAFGEIMLEGIEVGPSDTQEIYLGTIAIPNLKDGHIAVYEQSSGKKVEEIWSHMSHFLQIPAGTYKLAFGEIMLEGIEVGPSDTQEIYLGTIAIPNLKDGHIAVYEQSSGKKVGEIWSHMSHFLQVPTGTYKLEINGLEINDIAVEANQDVVLE